MGDHLTLMFYIFIDIIAVLFIALEMHFQKKRIINDKNDFSTNTFQTHSSKVFYPFAFLSFFVLFSVSALRDNVGMDYQIYLGAFLDVNNNTLTETQKNWLSPGYRLLCKIVGLFGAENYILMFAVTAFITLSLFYIAICKLSNNWTMSIYLLICFCLYYQTFNQVRQMLAISITFYALTYLKENQVKKYILAIIIAALMHTSAIVMLVLIIVRKWEMNKKIIFLYLSGGIIAYIGFDVIIYLLSFTNYGRTYLNWSKYNTSFELSSILNLIIRISFLIICLCYYKETVKRVPYTKILYNEVVICTILQLLTLKSYLFGRVTTYFFVPYIVLIPEVVITIKKSKNKLYQNLLTLAVYFLFAVYHCIYYFSPSGAYGSGYTEYHSLLF